jgi:hypothetical protein
MKECSANVKELITKEIDSKVSQECRDMAKKIARSVSLVPRPIASEYTERLTDLEGKMSNLADVLQAVVEAYQDWAMR